MALAGHGHELENFDNVKDVFKSWEDSFSKDGEFGSSVLHLL
jgi:hypothetical protein